MSKVRIPVNPMQVGKVGAYTMYVRKGEQIVRQRKNSSNYGSEASRTNPQQIRRAKWGNIVNSFKVMKDWQPKAWETAVGGKTDYNEFVGRNINSSGIYLTKDMCANGCAVLSAFMVSQGSIAPIGLEWSSVDSVFDTHITLSAAPGPGKTVGVVSADIFTNNPEFKNGDNLGIIFYSQQLDEREYPYLRSRYYEITLDTESTQQLSANPVYELIDLTESGSLCFSTPQLANWTDVGMVVIHTRKGNGLQVSTQKVVMCSDQFTQLFDTEAAMNAAIASYGQDNEVPLDPSFNPATSVRVTYRGSQIWTSGQGRVLIDASEGGELVIQGQNLNSEKNWVTFLADGASQAVRYIPLSVDSAGWHYILSANGRANVIINEYAACGVRLSGIEPPTGFPTRITMVIANENSFPTSGRTHQMSIEGVCLNYTPYMAEQGQSYRLSLSQLGTEIVQSDFQPVNATIVDFGTDGTTANSVLLSVTDASKPAYLYYQGVIIAVFNYS
jgi:hypothetical protein